MVIYLCESHKSERTNKSTLSGDQWKVLFQKLKTASQLKVMVGVKKNQKVNARINKII